MNWSRRTNVGQSVISIDIVEYSFWVIDEDLMGALDGELMGITNDA